MYVFTNTISNLSTLAYTLFVLCTPVLGTNKEIDFDFRCNFHVDNDVEVISLYKVHYKETLLREFIQLYDQLSDGYDLVNSVFTFLVIFLKSLPFITQFQYFQIAAYSGFNLINSVLLFYTVSLGMFKILKHDTGIYFVLSGLSNILFHFFVLGLTIYSSVKATNEVFDNN
jgi:hypothetical protein